MHLTLCHLSQPLFSISTRTSLTLPSVIVNEITEIDRRMNRQDQLNAALQEAASVPDGDIKDLALDVNVTKEGGSEAAEETGHDSEDDSNDLLNMGGGSDTPPPPPSGGGLGAAEEKSA